MKFDLQKIIGKTDSEEIFSFKVSIDNFNEYKKDCSQLFDFTVIEPIKINGKINNYADTILFEMNVSSKIKTICDRCLTDFIMPICGIAKTIVAVNPEDENNLDAIIPENNILDLTELAIEYFIINIPYKKICKEECKGICPVCGINLNTKKCGCIINKADSKFAALKDLL